MPGGSITLLSKRPEDPIVTDWAIRVAGFGGSVSIASRKAHSDFVRRLKQDNLWTKMSSGLIMPFASNGWNGAMEPLIAPSNSTFTPILYATTDYSFAGGIDPGSGNTDPKRIATNINAQSIFTDASVQVSVYRSIHRTARDSVANTLNGDDIQNRLQFHANWENGLLELDAFNWDTSIGRIQASGVTPTGLITGSRLSTQIQLVKNGVQINSATVAANGGGVPNANINLLGCFISSFSFYSRSNALYLYLGQALTAAEELIHYNHVQKLQTDLGRAI
jgi:hypothetical protein